MPRRKSIARATAGLVLAAAVLAYGTSGAQTEQASSLQHYSTADTPIRVLLADPAAREILRRHAPPFADTRRAALVGDDSLKAIQGYALAVLNDDVLARIDADAAQVRDYLGAQGYDVVVLTHPVFCPEKPGVVQVRYEVQHRPGLTVRAAR